MTSDQGRTRFKRQARRDQLSAKRLSPNPTTQNTLAMSYASVAAHNAPPPSEQPHADQSLLTTASDVQPVATAVDDSAKVNVAPSDFKSHPSTLTSEAADSIPPYPISKSPASTGKPSARKRAHDAEKKAEAKSLQLWGTIHEQLMRPAVAGGLIGVGSYIHHQCIQYSQLMPVSLL